MSAATAVRTISAHSCSLSDFPTVLMSRLYRLRVRFRYFPSLSSSAFLTDFREKRRIATLISTGRCNTEDGAASIGRWTDGAEGPAWVEARAEAGAVVTMESGGVSQRDRTRPGKAAWLDPRRRGFQRRVRAGHTTSLAAGAGARGASGDLPRAR